MLKNSELWRQADVILERLLRLPDEQRAQALAGMDLAPALRDCVDRLLAAVDGEGPLDGDAFALCGDELAAPDVAEGRQVGNYQLEALIGTGGMSAVYRAVRSDGAFDRPVAVKMLNQALLATDWRERFKREARLLSRLRHAGIAALIDAGVSETGVPYLVTELVDGRPIDRYCTEARASLRQRVGLLAQLAEAIAFAQSNLVIHRDIKPGNVLVTADGRIKLLDFGIAKPLPDATDPQPEAPPVTRVYTPEYAAPEQVSGLAVTTATDVFSLGALGYRLLTGTLPFSAGGGAREAPAASRALAGVLSRSDPADEVAAIRDSGFGPRQLRGDLDNILARCLAAEPERRYQNAQGLADDLACWLNHRPVQARRTPALLRLQKLVRRNPAASALAAVLVLLAGAGGGLVLDAQWQLAQRAAELETVVAFQSEMLRDLEPEVLGVDLRENMLRSLSEARELDETEAMQAVAGVNFTNLALELLDDAVLSRAATAAGQQFADQPLVLAGLLQNIADNYRDLGMPQKAEPVQQRALDLRLAQLGEGHPHTLQSLAWRTMLARQAGGEDVHGITLQLIELSERHLGADHPDTWRARLQYGQLLAETGSPQQAEPILVEVAGALSRLLGDMHEDTLAARANLAYAVMHMGRFEDAEVLLRRALEDSRGALGPAHGFTATTANNLGFTLRRLGHDEEAAEIYTETWQLRRRQLGDAHPQTLASLNNLAMLRLSQGQAEAAEPLFQQVYQGFELALGPNHVYTISLLNNLGGAARDLGRLDEALVHFEAAAGRARRTLGSAHASTASIVSNHGRALRETDDLSGAGPILHEAWRIAEASGQWRARQVTARELVDYYRQLASHDPADQAAGEALTHWQQALAGLDSP